MSLIRRYFDPIRSRWYANKSTRQTQLETTPLSLYLRLDDVYSYLVVQILDDLYDILIDDLKPIQLFISTQSGELPSKMSQQDWQTYCLNDAKMLAAQHGFAYDDVPEMPTAQAIAQAQHILQQSDLQGREFLYLLEDVFHMLWQQQETKLATLAMKAEHCSSQTTVQKAFQSSNLPILTAYFSFGHRQYHAIDGLLRLTRRLQQQQLLTAAPIFLINHIEWREHLIQGVEEVADIQALQPELDVYLAFEDPMSWLILQYLQEQLLEYYNIQLRIFPVQYQGKDDFDWGMVYRVAQRVKVDFAPFCRPNETAIHQMAKIFYSVDESQRLAMMLNLLQSVWTKGRDFSYQRHFKAFVEQQDVILQPQQVYQHLAQNTAQCMAYKQPDLPVLVLRIAGQQFVFNSFYRIWLIESIFSKVLEKQYQAEQNDEHE
ncbi:MAG: hypothetical protein Q4D05_02050 [Acinetobacter sp.]|nr:hypothetical protein [Acinetobacter sp.]